MEDGGIVRINTTLGREIGVVTGTTKETHECFVRLMLKEPMMEESEEKVLWKIEH